MNRRNTKLEKFVDKHLTRPLAVLYCLGWGIIFLGAIRTIAYGYGMELTHHWFDAPFRWLAQLFF